MHRCAVQKRTSLLALGFLSLWACMCEVWAQASCPGLPANGFAGVQSWSCQPGGGPYISCTPEAAQCFTGPLASPQALCLTPGVWVLNTTAGACQPGCGFVPLPPATSTYSWPDSCLQRPAGSVCTAECAVGYYPPLGSTAPQMMCSGGSWVAAGPDSGSCILPAGGTSRYVTVVAPPDVVALIAEKISDGQVMANVNEQLAAYQGLLRRDFTALKGFFDLYLANLWVVDRKQSGLRRRMQRRKLAEGSSTQTESITVGYQFRSQGKGLIPAAKEAVLDLVTRNTQVLSAINSVSVGYAIQKGWLPATYDFSQISYGSSDENGTFLQPPTMSVACFIFFDTNTTKLPIGGGDEQLQHEALSQSADVALCPNVDTISASFPYQASANAGTPSFTAVALNLATNAAGQDAGIDCTVSAGSGESTSQPVVTCSRKDGSLFSQYAMYKVMMTADFNCDSKQLTAYAATNFRIRQAPRITIVQQGAIRPSVCATEREFTVTFNYTMVNGAGEEQAADLAAVVTSGDAGLNCRVRLIKGPTSSQAMRLISTGTATVTCSGQLQAGSNIDINLILQASLQGCAAPLNFSAKARVSITCCQHGSSYARQSPQGSLKAKCWQHFLPGTRAGQCKAPTIVHGIFNQGPAAAKLIFFNNQTNRCATRDSVGTAILTCTPSEPRRLSFKMQSSHVDRRAPQLFMVRCNPPPAADKCPGDIRWLNVSAKSHNASIVVVGNTKTTTFDYELPATAECSCLTAFWSLYEEGVYTGLPKRLCGV